MNRDGDRGAVSTQLAVLAPVLLALMLLSVQFALAWHAQHIAQTAAARGLADARAHNGSTSAGAEMARATLRSLAGRVLQAPQVEVTRTATTARVEAEGTVIRLLPVLDLTVRGQAQGPVERFTTPQEAGQ